MESALLSLVSSPLTFHLQGLCKCCEQSIGNYGKACIIYFTKYYDQLWGVSFRMFIGGLLSFEKIE